MKRTRNAEIFEVLGKNSEHDTHLTIYNINILRILHRKLKNIPDFFSNLNTSPNLALETLPERDNL